MARPTVKSENSNAFTGGRRTVTYRDARGRTHDAVVTGEGTDTDEVNLEVRQGGGGTLLLTDVPRATGEKDTGVWFWRTTGR